MVTKVKDEELYPIKIRGKEYKKLEGFKVHPKQPFWEIIKDILSKFKK